MKKATGLLLVIIITSMVILTACNNFKSGQVDGELNTDNLILASDLEEPDSKEIEEEETSLAPFDLTSEEGIRDYLVGQWFCNIEYMSNIDVNMNIYENLDVELSFHDFFTNESKGSYKGKIIFDWMYADLDKSPDIISIELEDSKYSKGDFFFAHRTIYDEKRVMSLFTTGNGKSVFDILLGYEDEDYDYTIEEVMLEKKTSEVSEGKTRKNDSFYAVFWGHEVLYDSIWLDDVDWTPSEEGDFATDYPRPMTEYKNDKYESIIYKVQEDKEFEILGDNMFKGTVYYVETDDNGDMVELIDAAYKKYLEESEDDYFHDNYTGAVDYYFEEGSEDYIDPEFADLIFSFLKDIVEVEEYLDSGMSILFTGETIIIDGGECYFVFLGTNLEEAFVREIHYAVNTSTGQVYHYDILNDTWELVSLY